MWVPVVVFFLGLLMLYHPTLLRGFEAVQTDVGDTRLGLFILEHSFRWLQGLPLHASYWDPPFFYPAKNVAAYSETLLSVAPYYWMWRAMGAGEYTALQLWMISVSTLNFVAAFVLFRCALKMSQLSASLGAFFFAFANLRASQLNHHQLVSQFYAVAAVFALLKVFNPQTPAQSKRARLWILTFAVFSVCHIYGGFYSGWFFAFGLCFLFAFALFESRLRARLWELMRYQTATLVGVALLSALALYPMASHYLNASHQVGMRDMRQAAGMVPRIASWFYMGPQNWLYGELFSLSIFQSLLAEHEHRIGLGYLTSVISFGALVYHRHRLGVRTLLWATLALVGCATWFPFDLSLWPSVFHTVPGANALRAVARIGLMLLFPASLGMAVFVQQFEQHRARVVGTLIVVACVLEQGQSTEAFRKSISQQEVSRLAAMIQADCEAFYVSPRQPTSSWEVPHVDAMLTTLTIGKPTVNGYSGNHPPHWYLWRASIFSTQHEEQLYNALKHWTKMSHGSGKLCWIKPWAHDQPNAALIKQSVPGVMHTNQPYKLRFTFKNTGRTTWSQREGYALVPLLESASEVWKPPALPLRFAVLPDEEVTYTVALRAPAQAGTYRLQWVMRNVRVHGFGQPSTPVHISVP